MHVPIDSTAAPLAGAARLAETAGPARAKAAPNARHLEFRRIGASD
ncbi:MAG TPA: hypothetical protein VFC47_10420 [Caulobacteraceae bacterium]|nr:hypothetical protein [Caulobacteraceae bacterium]